MSLMVSRKGNPSRGELRELIVGALGNLYPGHTMLDPSFALMPEVMLIMQADGALRVVGYDGVDSGKALMSAMEAAGKIDDHVALLPRLYPQLSAMRGGGGVKISVVAPHDFAGSRYLKADCFTCMVLDVDGRAAVMVEPMDAGIEPESEAPPPPPAAAPAEQTVTVQSPVVEEPMENDSLLTEEEENFFRQI